MTRRREPSWTDLAFDSWLLAYDASAVMWLRSMRLAAGGKLAEREARRMVEEKVSAGLALGPALASEGLGASPQKLGARTLAHYGKPVRANRRRLSRRR